MSQASPRRRRRALLHDTPSTQASYKYRFLHDAKNMLRASAVPHCKKRLLLSSTFLFCPPAIFPCPFTLEFHYMRARARRGPHTQPACSQARCCAARVQQYPTQPPSLFAVERGIDQAKPCRESGPTRIKETIEDTRKRDERGGVGEPKWSRTTMDRRLAGLFFFLIFCCFMSAMMLAVILRGADAAVASPPQIDLRSCTDPRFTRRGTWCRWRWPRRRRHGQPCRGRWRA